MNNDSKISITCRNCGENFIATYNLSKPFIYKSSDILGNDVYTDSFNNIITKNPKYPNRPPSISFRCKYCNAAHVTTLDKL